MSPLGSCTTMLCEGVFSMRSRASNEKGWTVWLTRAASNLARARQGRHCAEVLYEDLCFDAQQAAEKSLKALLVFFGLTPPRTHSIGYLLKILRDAAKLRGRLQIPAEVRQAAVLSDYAVTTRYPGDWEPVDEDEYREAVDLAEEVYRWVLSTIQRHD